MVNLLTQQYTSHASDQFLLYSCNLFLSSKKATLNGMLHKTTKPVVTLGPQTVAIDIPLTKGSAVPVLAVLPNGAEKIPLVGSLPVKAPPAPNLQCNLTRESHHQDPAHLTKGGKSLSNNSIPSAHSAPVNDAWLPPGGTNGPDNSTTSILGLSPPSREGVEERENGELTNGSRYAY